MISQQTIFVCLYHDHRKWEYSSTDLMDLTMQMDFVSSH